MYQKLSVAEYLKKTTGVERPSSAYQNPLAVEDTKIIQDNIHLSVAEIKKLLPHVPLNKIERKCRYLRGLKFKMNVKVYVGQPKITFTELDFAIKKMIYNYKGNNEEAKKLYELIMQLID